MIAKEAAEPRYELEKYRPYLSLLVRLDLDPRLQGKLDLSGVIQQTLLEGHRGLPGLREAAEEARLAWLRRILNRNLIDEVRKLRRLKAFAVLDRSLDELSSVAESNLIAEQTSPSQQAIRHEELLQLSAALSKLSRDQQTAVIRHHLQGASLATVALEMGKSRTAVAGLLHRGLTKLRTLLEIRSNSEMKSA